MRKTKLLTDLSTYDPQTGDIQVIVETPRDSRNKIKYETRSGLFILDKVLADLDERILIQIEHFFIAYNTCQDRQFKPIGRAGVAQAMRLLEESRKRYDRQKSDRKSEKQGRPE